MQTWQYVLTTDAFNEEKLSNILRARFPAVEIRPGRTLITDLFPRTKYAELIRESRVPDLQVKSPSESRKRFN